MLRIYPIRTTKNQWNIYFYCKHKCTTKCEYIIMSDSTELVLENNPDFSSDTTPKYKRSLNEQWRRWLTAKRWKII